MPKPSEYLTEKWCKPWNPNVHPNATMWVDPKTQEKVDFIHAVLTQSKRDEVKE